MPKTNHNCKDETCLDEHISDNNLYVFIAKKFGNYGYIVIGDMSRLCNYGLTKRNGNAHIVLLDSGLTEDVWNTYYKRW